MTYLDVLARARARERGRAVVVRECATITADAAHVFGFAPIKMVSEELIQAIAFGMLDADPQLVARWNPLSRDASDLEPFAAALDDYLLGCEARDELPRIWVPHKGALDALELLGHRYRRNSEASQALQRMGAQCRALAEEARVPGQQVVAVARELLAAHVVTGQSPVEDGHLGALLAWARPAQGVDPAEEAARRALIPASAMLVRHVDDRVEALRREGKRKGPGARRARVEIANLLTAGARAEWELLVEAREAFWDLGLAPGDLDDLVDASRDRLAFTLVAFPGTLVSPHALARELEQHERGVELVEEADLTDFAMRERARRRGGVFEAEVLARDPAVPTRNGFELQLHTAQETLRAREGSGVRLLDGKVSGRVLEVRGDPNRGGYRLRIRAKGVRSREQVEVGSVAEWADQGPVDMRFVRQKARAHVQRQAPALAYADALPPATPRRLPAGSLLEIAEGRRR